MLVIQNGTYDYLFSNAERGSVVPRVLYKRDQLESRVKAWEHSIESQCFEKSSAGFTEYEVDLPKEVVTGQAMTIELQDGSTYSFKVPKGLGPSHTCNVRVPKTTEMTSLDAIDDDTHDKTVPVKGNKGKVLISTRASLAKVTENALKRRMPGSRLGGVLFKCTMVTYEGHLRSKSNTRVCG